MKIVILWSVLYPYAIFASRFQFQGPVLTLTLKDPISSQQSQTIGSSDSAGLQEKNLDSEDDDQRIPKTHTKWWKRMRNSRLMFSNSPPSAIANILNLDSLAPILLYSIRTINTPLPNYMPSLKSASVTAAYNYHELKNRPSTVESDVSFHSNRLKMDFDLSSTYDVRNNNQAIVIRVSKGDYDGDSSTTNGAFGLIRLVTKAKKLVNHACAQYRFGLPFQTVGSISITPSYDFQQNKAACSIVGKSGSGRTAAILDLNWDRPSLSVVHALDERNTIQPEISLYDAKILYNWSLKLMDGSGVIKTRVDPTSAVQVTWIDITRNGKWVTDFKLPLVGIGGPLAGDIRVRRQFVF